MDGEQNNTPPSAMVESILLDDESLLSPESEKPPEGPLNQLDHLSPEQLQKKIAESKSMENIVLETSPTKDGVNIPASEVAETAAETSAAEDEVVEEAVVAEAAEEAAAPPPVPPVAADSQESSAAEAEADTMRKNSDYFLENEEQDDLFDDLPTTRVSGRQRTTSVNSEEAVPVAFEEAKGSGIKFVGSMQNVSRFFTDDAGGNDEEGKSFFDSFTAGETEDAVQLSTSPKPDMMIPVTPPIPSSSSPLPSPMHGFTPRSRTTSHSSPVHSPIPEHDAELAGDSSPFQDSSDIFTQSLNVSDNDRRNDAWIPSETTRQAFITMATSAPGTYVPDPSLLTSPHILADEPQGDPVQTLLAKFLGDAEASKRQSLSADQVSQDELGLRKLIENEAYRSAIDLTGRLLTIMGQGVEKTDTPIKHSPYTLQLWLTRIAMLMKLRQYNQADSELQAFGSLDHLDLFFDYYPDNYPGRKGSMVPFALRVLHAELPQFLGKSMDTLDRLYYIHAIIQQILGNLEADLAEDGSELELSAESRKASKALWEKREIQILYCVCNCLLNIKDYATAVTVCETLLKKDPPNKTSILNGMGRIYVQMGDMKSAQHYFEEAEKLTDSQKPKAKLLHLMNIGFISLGNNQFPEAFSNFKEAVTIDPKNAVAVNNMAVCALYMGKLKEAIDTLETLVTTDPQKYLHEGLLFNLCTLYELESSHAMQKKQSLLSLVSQHKNNGFNVACLKMA